MNLTNEQLNDITEYSKIYGFTFSDVCDALGYDYSKMSIEIQDKNSPIYLAFRKGKLTRKAELENKIHTLSIQGSGPAQALALKIQKEQEFQQLLDFYAKH